MFVLIFCVIIPKFGQKFCYDNSLKWWGEYFQVFFFYLLFVFSFPCTTLLSSSSAKSINLGTIRKCIIYSFKKMLVKLPFTFIVFEILLFKVGRRKRVKFSVTNQSKVQLLLKLLEKWLWYYVTKFWTSFFFNFILTFQYWKTWKFQFLRIQNFQKTEKHQ